jgi:hypothetical protein
MEQRVQARLHSSSKLAYMAACQMPCFQYVASFLEEVMKSLKIDTQRMLFRVYVYPAI